MKIIRVLPLIAIAVIAVIIWRTATPSGDAPNVTTQTTPSTPTVAASNYPIADIARSIAGDDIAVVQIIPTGADPHVFEPTPSLVATLHNVDAAYMIGGEYDKWIAQYIDEEGAIHVTDGLDLRTNAHDEIDPHVWLTIPNAIRIAEAIADDLSARFPASATAFRENAARFAATATQTDATIRALLATAPNHSLVASHDAWYYFAEEYGFTVLDTFEEDHGTEPSSRHLADLATQMRAAGLTTIATDAGVRNAALTQFAEDNGFTIVTVDPEGIAAHPSYLDLMYSNAQAFSQNR